MTQIQKALFEKREESYAAFQAKLIPNIDPETILGVRVPVLRALAKKLAGTKEANAFLRALPHAYLEENLLHGLILEREKDFDTCVFAIEAFLPHIDNWATCDIPSPKVFCAHKEALYPILQKWIASAHVYTCRFGLGMLMRHFLDGDFAPEVLELAASAAPGEYYVNMMVAWFFATALSKQWDAAIGYLEARRLDPDIHGKTIRKACESYRITPKQKAYLKGLK